MNMEWIKNIEDEALKEIENTKTEQELLLVKSKYLGDKGKITLGIKGIKDLDPSLRRDVGYLLNEAKRKIKKAISEKKFVEEEEFFDETLPPIMPSFGKLHPITKIMNEVVSLFVQLGFSISEGPEIELIEYNFDALNIPPSHPARDMHDTFYVDDKWLLRTHTSPVQIRVMKEKKPPIRIIAPGRVYRRDSDISHSPMFHQVEGLLVDHNISFSNLKGILSFFLQEMFGHDAEIRFRPSYFPFTEPSSEVDIGCILCSGKGCRTCKNTGWLEILGAGMVDPEVFKYVGIDSEKYTGFAFGLGIERIAMLKYGISDIRLFFENDWRFLTQF
ncbi:TPA: phenylalanine--tRNA ligase subunit alpha [bacterium]|nr:phenylalanine--tRNA ligase subunit alpha [bacterium]